MMLATLTWHPHVHPLLCGGATLALVAWIYWLYRRMLTRMSPARARLLLAPKAVVLALILLAAFDPAWQARSSRHEPANLLVALDASSSMDVKDGPDGRSRLARAADLVERLKRRLGSGVRAQTLWFDTQLRSQPPSPKGAAVRGTDLGACLRTLAERQDLSACLGLVLATDGGDDPLDGLAVPGAPLYIVGVGSNPTGWCDIALGDLSYPAAVEKGAQFEIAADLRASEGLAGRTAALRAVHTTLESERPDGTWQKEAERDADLSNLRARVRFRASADAVGLRNYRVSVAGANGELSELNNRRAFTIQVQKAALNVLFFTRELGASLKMIRAELASDPGITFTALFRTIGERFTVQGERRPGDEDLNAGFPADANVLKLFDAVIIGSFPLSDWSEAQMKALSAYVEQGGSVVFLGGEESFGRGGYADSALAPLFPWTLSAGEPEMSRGSFPAHIPSAAVDHPVVAGLNALLLEDGQAALESANHPGPLKPAATALLNAGVGEQVVAIVATQPYGKGKVLALASNTFWKWARQSRALSKAYGLFWRQAIRYLGGAKEGGRLFSVTWDKESYRPGESATITLRLLGGESRQGLRLAASIARDGEAQALPVEPIEGQADGFVVKTAFPQRGLYRLKLTAFRAQEAVETYEKIIAAAPFLPEGARLEVNEAALTDLAKKGGGLYVREAEENKLAQELIRRGAQRFLVTENSFICGSPWFLILVLAALLAEWVLRRKMNLF